MTDAADRLYEHVLVLRCQAGDEDALAALIERYQPRLRYYVRKMLRDADAAEDILQEVWFDVFRAIGRLVEAGAFRAWLYRIAHDRAARQLRRRRLPYQALQDVDPPDVGAEDVGLAAEEAERIHAALDQLVPAHREVLVLRFVECMDYEEIARVLSCQLGTVRSRLHYAKRALRSILEETNENEQQRAR